jgi:mycothiol synthase
MALGKTAPELIQEFSIRSATMDDLEAAVNLFNTYKMEYHGVSNETVEELRVEWSDPDFKLETSTCGFFTPQGELIAFGQIWESQVPVRPHIWFYVVPDYRQRGIGTYLANWVDTRARQAIDRVPETARVVMETSAFYTDDRTKQFLVNKLGMKFANQSWWEMAIDMAEEPAPAQWPEGVTVKSYVELEDARAVFTASRTSFEDHRGYVEEPFERDFERWKHHNFKDVKFDPSLWFLAVLDGQIVGVSLCRWEGWSDPTGGYVDTLGVVREHRRKGIAEALLRHSFGEFWKRGRQRVTLHVDGSSLTGANRLYERVGMHVSKSFDSYEKELRPGEELSRQ